MRQLALSIVIPTYNSLKLVFRCLRSLEAQTYYTSSFEVLVVDDGSTDNSLERLKNYETSSPLNLKILSIPHGGPAEARNFGVSHASADWVAFLDADIIVGPEWIQRSITLLSQYPEVGGFEGRTETCDTEKITPFTHQTINESGGRYPTCNLIFRKSLCKFYPEYKIPFREDSDLAFTVLESGYKIMFDSQLLVFHPPLEPKYFRPIQLAKRYYYDGLLAKRFPERYKNDIDVHYILRMRIPHLRKKIYGIFAISQVIGLSALLLPMMASHFVIYASHLIHLLSYIAVLLIHTRSTDISRLNPKDFLVLMGITYIVPWIMLVQLWRGHLAFKQRPAFPRSSISASPAFLSTPALLKVKRFNQLIIKKIPSIPKAVNLSHRLITSLFQAFLFK